MSREVAVRRSAGPAQLGSRARAHRRRFARKLGVGLRDLDAVTAELLAHWALLRARLDLDGSAENSERFWRASNATARALRRLEERVRELGLDTAAKGNGRTLESYLRERYGGNGGGER